MDRPIMITTELIRPLVDDVKTETRRTTGLEQINEKPDDWLFWGFAPAVDDKGREVAYFKSVKKPSAFVYVPCPYGKDGDRLWIRETWYVDKGFDEVPPSKLPQTQPIRRGYMADHPDGEKPGWAGVTRPSIFMPRWLSRVAVEIELLNVERIQSITEPGARLEGAPFVSVHEVPYDKGFGYLEGFKRLWATLHGEGSWKKNPWVWVIKFKRVHG